jgi:hypothetical protein
MRTTITKTNDAIQLVAGGSTTYTLAVTNVGPGASACPAGSGNTETMERRVVGLLTTLKGQRQPPR